MTSPFRMDFEPFDALSRLQQQLERAVDGPKGSWERLPSGRGVFPPVNVFNERDGYVLRIEVPGVTPENLQIETQANTLRISGKRGDAGESKGSHHRRERWLGEFSRSLQLPQELDLAKASAAYKNGILTLHVPRREEAKPRQIAVAVSGA